METTSEGVERSYGAVPFPNIAADAEVPFYQPIEEVCGSAVRVGGESFLMLGSSDYLGLGQHPEVLEAAAGALRKYGSTCAGSPTLNGSLSLHRELEAEVADFLRREDAAVFASGFQANLGVLTALGGRRATIVCDRLSHASLIDGGGLARSKMAFFAHNDAGALARALGEAHPDRPRWVIAEGAYSVDGDLCDLQGIAAVAREHGARLLLDEAHSLGTVGPRGGGLLEEEQAWPEVEVTTGTFSKALASVGGFVAGSAAAIDRVRQKARSLIFSAALAPPSAAAALAALRVLRREPERVGELASRTRILFQELEAAGYEVRGGEAPIVTIGCGRPEVTVDFWRELRHQGIFTNAIISPAVRPNEGRIRISVTTLLSEADLAHSVRVFRGLVPRYRSLREGR